MKFYTYIYGRTLKIDFREICTSPSGISERSKSLIKELVNTDVVSNGEITRPRYLFVREENQVIFGMGVNHLQCFEKTYQTDESGRRGLRSFIGIVVDSSEFDKMQSIPIELDFYVKLYLEQIIKVWELEDRPRNREVIKSASITVVPQDDWVVLNGSLSFNNYYDRCRLFGKNEEDSVFSSLKNCRSAVMIGLNNEGHVSTAAKRFNVFIPNALCDDTTDRKELSWTQEDSGQRSGRNAAGHTVNDRPYGNSDDLMDIWGDDDAGKPVNDLPSYSTVKGDKKNPVSTDPPTSQQPKKDSRLKLIVIGAFSLAFVIGFILGRCSRENQKFPHQSISGSNTEVTNVPE